MQSDDRCLCLLVSTTLTTSRTLAKGKAGVLTTWLATQYVIPLEGFMFGKAENMQLLSVLTSKHTVIFIFFRFFMLT